MPAKGSRFPAEVLSRDEIHRLIKACSPRAPTGIRNRALVGLLYRSGLRISEALALQTKDIDPRQGTLRVLHGKGNKARTVGMDPEAFALIDVWMKTRKELGVGHGALFCTLKGGPVGTAYVRHLLPRLARRAGIHKRVHAHGFRHALASELRAEGVEIGTISKALGHSSIATTARYLDHVAPQAVVDAMRGRAWRQQSSS